MSAPRSRLERWRRMLGDRRELLRLNHIFIPAKKQDRDRFRKSRVGRLIQPTFAAYLAMSREGRALFTLTLMVGLAGLDIRSSQVHLLFAMLVATLLASLTARPFFRARGLRIKVDAPARVTVGQRQTFLITLSNEAERALASVRVMLPFLPWDGSWQVAPPGVAAIAPGKSERITAEGTFLARGEHHLDAVEAALLVPLGLTLGPRRLSNEARFLVVPRIPNVAALSVRHRLPERNEARVLSREQGESEFSGVRPYKSGDPLKHLHARTWARTGTPHIKTYAAERSDRIGVAVLCDGDAVLDSTKEAALSLAAGITSRLLAQGDGVSLVCVDLTVFRVTPRSGRAALDAVLDRLAVHSLTQRVEPVEQSVLDIAPELSALFLVTSDDEPRRRALIDDLEQRGLPVVWAVVHPTRPAKAPPHQGDRRAKYVDAARLEQGEVIVL